jgi:hypothetical protein
MGGWEQAGFASFEQLIILVNVVAKKKHQQVLE